MQKRIARSITLEIHKDAALMVIAKALAATDPDRAERVAQSITGDPLRVENSISCFYCSAPIGQLCASRRKDRCET